MVYEWIEVDTVGRILVCECDVVCFKGVGSGFVVNLAPRRISTSFFVERKLGNSYMESCRNICFDEIVS